MSKILFHDGQVVNHNGLFLGGLVVENGVIVDVFEGDFSGNFDDFDEVVDLAGKTGGIDTHVHFREPGASYKEDFEHGSRSALAGGITTVFDMPNNNPGIVDGKSLADKFALINGRSYVNYGLYMAYNGENADEINASEDIIGVKIYCAHSTGNMGVGTDHIEGAFRKIDSNKILVFHAEDEECIERHREEVLSSYGDVKALPASVHSEIRAPECALKMVKYLCELAQKYGRKIHIAHVSTAEEVEVLKKYSNVVSYEVAPHHLHFTTDDYVKFGNFIKVNPPVRKSSDVFVLWKALQADEVAFVVTDHAPHTVEEKQREYLDAPSGIPGVQFNLPLLVDAYNNDALTLPQVVRLSSYSASEMFGFFKKGRIEVGADADLVVFDLDAEFIITDDIVLSKCGWTPYKDSLLKGKVLFVYLAGKLAYKDGEFVGKARGKVVNV